MELPMDRIPFRGAAAEESTDDDGDFGESDVAHLTDLGRSFLYDFQQSGDATDIDNAVIHLRHSMELLSPCGGNELAECLSDLGFSLQKRFERFGSVDDIHESVTHLRACVSLGEDSRGGQLPLYLNNLGCSLRLRFKCLGEGKDLEEAIEDLQRSVDISSSLTEVAADVFGNGQDGLPVYLNNLGNALTYRFEQSGAEDDIDTALKYLHLSVDLTPGNSHDLPRRLANLSCSLLLRFTKQPHDQDQTDLESAITHLRESIRRLEQQHAPSSTRDLPTYLNILGTAITYRFERSGQVHDIDEAIRHMKHSVSLTRADDRHLPVHLNNLGYSLRCLFERSWSGTDIDESIGYIRESVRLTSPDSRDLPYYLENLALSLLPRFRVFKEPRDLKEAIDHLRESVKLTPVEACDLTGRVLRLGDSLKLQFELDGA